MKKIHITLVGSQTIPCFNGIMDDKPDSIILVCSDSSESDGIILKNVIKKEHNKDCDIVLFHPVDPTKIRLSLKDLDSIIMIYDMVTVNLSGGSKPWSILFFEHFINIKNTKCIFVDQNNMVWDLKTGEKHILSHTPSITEIFQLTNSKVKKHTNYSVFSHKDFQAIKDIREIRKINYSAFNTICTRLNASPTSTYQEDYATQSFIRWDQENNAYHIEMEDKRHKIHKKTISSPNVRNLLIKSGWFELEVANFLSRWDIAKDMWMNCDFTSDTPTTEATLNEIDIIINNGDKLLFVECKTQVSAPTDIDKFKTALTKYGGKAAKSLFITDVNMKPEAAEKCRQHDIPYFALQNIKSNSIKEKMFFEFMTKNMGIINK